MARNKKTMKADDPAPSLPSERLSFQKSLLLAVGGGLVLLGFIVLSKSDPMGGNFAATLSPLLILGGYSSVGAGLLLR